MSPEQTRVDEAIDQRLGEEGFAKLFGITTSELPERCRALIAAHDFRYRPLWGAERDRVLTDVFKRIDTGDLTVAGKERREQWEKGWAENLESFRQGDREVSALIPKYIRPQQPVRLHQDYVMPVAPHFELHWYEIFQHWLFATYFEEAEVIYEFGCGSGINLAALAQLYPHKRFVGLDWAAASKGIIDEMAGAYGWDMQGRVFDFFEPDEQIRIEPKSMVFTVGALEQTGRNYEAFLQYLLRQPPGLCVNIEPIVEWYDDQNLVDYAAIRFHRQRKYMEGFPTRLKQLEGEGRIEILKMKRSYFGSLFMEGYSQTIWRPTGTGSGLVR